MASAASRLPRRLLLAIAVAIGVATIAALYISNVSLLPKSEKEPATLLEPGWQFYPRPTSTEPPGTVFRVDGTHHRYVVEFLEVPTTTGKEVFGKTTQAMQTTAQALSRIIGKPVDASASQDGKRVETLEFEMTDVERELTTDAMIADILDKFREKIDYKRGNRYFVIREARSAKALHYTLSEQLANSLGGKGSIAEFVKTQAGLSYESRGKYVISQELPTRMRVMFLAEEIVPVSSSFGGAKPDFETVPVREVVVWE